MLEASRCVFIFCFWGGGCVLKLPGLVSGSEDRTPRGEILVTDGNVPKGLERCYCKGQEKEKA